MSDASGEAFFLRDEETGHFFMRVVFTAADLAVLVPPVLLLTMAGLALLPALTVALREVTAGPLVLGPIFAFTIALSHMSLLGLGPFFWSLVIVVTIKYHVYVLRFDNRGEGGILVDFRVLEFEPGDEKPHPGREPFHDARRGGRRGAEERRHVR